MDRIDASDGETTRRPHRSSLGQGNCQVFARTPDDDSNLSHMRNGMSGEQASWNDPRASSNGAYDHLGAVAEYTRHPASYLNYPTAMLSSGMTRHGGQVVGYPTTGAPPMIFPNIGHRSSANLASVLTYALRGDAGFRRAYDTNDQLYLHLGPSTPILRTGVAETWPATVDAYDTGGNLGISYAPSSNTLSSPREVSRVTVAAESLPTSAPTRPASIYQETLTGNIGQDHTRCSFEESSEQLALPSSSPVSSPSSTSSVYPSHSCSECSAQFHGRSAKGNLNRHVQSIHRRTVATRCRRCGKTFSRPDIYSRHSKDTECARNTTPAST